MIEVEVKIPLTDRIRIEEKLQNSEFRKDCGYRETDTYFNSRFYNIREMDQALRIRSCENLLTGERESFITYKGSKLDAVSMTRKELETSVGNADICREILESLGFYALAEVRKVRQYYRSGMITVCLDQVEGLGDFLELESLVEDESDRERALEQLYSILNELGLKKNDTIQTSYLSMLGFKKE